MQDRVILPKSRPVSTLNPPQRCNSFLDEHYWATVWRAALVIVRALYAGGVRALFLQFISVVTRQIMPPRRRRRRRLSLNIRRLESSHTRRRGRLLFCLPLSSKTSSLTMSSELPLLVQYQLVSMHQRKAP